MKRPCVMLMTFKLLQNNLIQIYQLNFKTTFIDCSLFVIADTYIYTSSEEAQLQMGRNVQLRKLSNGSGPPPVYMDV